MKNVFAYRDLTPDGSVFVSRSPESGLAEKKKKSDEEALRFQKLTMLPKLLQLVLLIAVGAGAILLTVGLDMLTDGEFTGDNRLAIILASVGGGLFAVGLLFIVIGTIRSKRVIGSGAFKMYEGEREKLMREVKESLAIPSDAVKCDVFSCRYLPKKNRQKRMPFFKNSYLSLETEMWREGEAFCAFDGDAVFKFPFESVIETERVEKRITFYGWNKPEKHNKGKYKLYKVRYNSNGEYYTVKPVYRVRLFHESEEYEILIPAYEKETLEKLLGKTLT